MAVDAFKLALKRHNFFLLGGPGSGKSVLLNKLFTILEKDYDARGAVVMLASTGKATEQLSPRANPQTIHSWLGLTPEIVAKGIAGIRNHVSQRPEIIERISSTMVVLIDEISLVSSHFLNIIDVCLRQGRLPDKPFGGIQMILCGDFRQLAPVPTPSIGDLGEPAFMCPAVQYFHIVELESIYRQTDPQFIKAIEETALGHISRASKTYLKMLNNPIHPEPPYTLYATNLEVDVHNARRLLEREGELEIYYSQDTSFKRRAFDDILVPKQLLLKRGCPVIVLKNIGQYLHNGSIGTYLGPDGDALIVKCDGRLHHLKTAAFTSAGSTRIQYPLKLAYSLTIHKAQGMTLPSVRVDAKKIRQTGQLAVAISRVRNPGDLQLVNFERAKCPAQPVTVVNFYNKECPPLPDNLDDNEKCCRRPPENHGPGDLSDHESDLDTDSDFCQEELSALDILLEQYHQEELNQQNRNSTELLVDHADGSNEQTPEGVLQLRAAKVWDRDLADKLCNERPLDVDRFYSHCTAIAKAAAEPIAKGKSKAKKSQLVSNYSSLMFSVSISPGFLQSIGLLFNITTDKLTTQHTVLAADFLDHIRYTQLQLVANSMDLRATSLSTAVNEPAEIMRTPHGRGKLRYLAGRTVHKAKLCIIKKLRTSLSKNSKNLIDILQKTVDILETLEAEESALLETTSDPESLKLTSGRQHQNRGLTNVSDDCFDFFLYIDQRRLQLVQALTLSDYNADTPFSIKKEITDDAAVRQEWDKMFSETNSITDFLYLNLTFRYFLVANNQHKKSLLQSLHKTKKHAHRIDVKLPKSKKKRY